MNPEIKLKPTESANKFDVILTQGSMPNAHGSNYQIKFILYPYSRSIHASDYQFTPYSEYVEDIQMGDLTTYSLANDNLPKFFGLSLGALIVLLFGMFKPSDIFSIQSVVSVLGAYAIGKELWVDFDSALARFTKKLPIRWLKHEPNYVYNAEHEFTTELDAARNKRYSIETTLANNFRLVTNSNSQNLKLNIQVDAKDQELRLFSIKFDPHKLDHLTKYDAMVISKIEVERNFLGFKSVQQFVAVREHVFGKQTSKTSEKRYWQWGRIRIGS